MTFAQTFSIAEILRLGRAKLHIRRRPRRLDQTDWQSGSSRSDCDPGDCMAVQG